MKLQFVKLISFLTILFFFNACNREFRNYINSKQTPLKVYLAPTIVEINIYFLRTISSQKAEKEKTSKRIKEIVEDHANWFNYRLEEKLEQKGVSIVSKENADLILESKILDLGEVRTKKFIEGLSVGLVIGAIIGEMTGDPQVGLAVFVWEVIEEIIIVYLLKSFLMISTIGLTVKKQNESILLEKEFTSYSNRDYEKTVPENLRDLRETRVHGSLDQNVNDIVDFLQKTTKKN